jgi:hypothetical protein
MWTVTEIIRADAQRHVVAGIAGNAAMKSNRTSMNAAALRAAHAATVKTAAAVAANMTIAAHHHSKTSLCITMAANRWPMTRA